MPPENTPFASANNSILPILKNVPLSDLPTGIVTYLLAEIENSDQPAEDYAERLGKIAQTVKNNKGQVFQNIATQVTPTTVCGVFDLGGNILKAAEEIGRFEQSENFPARVALYTGQAEIRGGYYFGSTLNRAARLLAAAHPGQVLVSASTADLLRPNLSEVTSLRNLGQHRMRTLVRPEQIYQLAFAGLPGSFPPLRTLDNRQSNLPAETTGFIGRDIQIVEIRRLLTQPTSRLITLTGVGGVGKSRLGMQVASRLIEDFEQGVFWVTLATLNDPSLFLSTMTQALGIREGSNKPLMEVLKDYLQNRHLLLFLDNFDHVMPAAPLLMEILEVSPRLKLLVTAQKKLGLPLEIEYVVPAMRVPVIVDRANMAVEQLEQTEAVKLFVERAQVTSPDFRLTRGNVSQVAELLARLEGLPLAIELAASRSDVLANPSLAQTRVAHNPNVADKDEESGLRGTLDWSYNLLEADEKRLFIRLGVFVNGCSVEAAEAVCNSNGDLWLGVPDRMDMLARRGLLRFKETANNLGVLVRRYEMLESVREYALERMSLKQEVDPVRGAHARYYLKFVENAPAQARRPQEWLEQIDIEYDNLRAALEWASKAQDRADLALKLVAALSRYWYLRGLYSEGRERLSQIFKRIENTGLRTTYQYARALNTAGLLARLQGDFKIAREHGEASLTLFREFEDKAGIATTLNNLGQLAIRQGDYSEAQRIFEESLEIFKELDSKEGIAEAMNGLGDVALSKNQFELARQLSEEALALARSVNDTNGLGFILHTLGRVAMNLREYSKAAQLLEEGLSYRRRTGDKWGLAATLNIRGGISFKQNDFSTARTYFEESLLLRRELGDTDGVAAMLGNLGLVAYNIGDLAQAQTYIEESVSMVKQTDSKPRYYNTAVNLAQVLLERNEYDRSETLMAECIQWHMSVGNRLAILEGLVTFAGLAAWYYNNYERGIELMGSADNLLNSWNIQLEQATERLRDKLLGQLKSKVSTTVFEVAWNKGMALGSEEAVGYALTKPENFRK